VSDDHRLSDELQKGRKRLFDPGGFNHHRLGDPGQDRDERRDLTSRVHQGLEGRDQIAALVDHRPDLRDLAIGRRPTGGFEIEDAEGNFE
jgi:hypothetical protein